MQLDYDVDYAVSVVSQLCMIQEKDTCK